MGSESISVDLKMRNKNVNFYMNFYINMDSDMENCSTIRKCQGLIFNNCLSLVFNLRAFSI